MPGHGLDDPIQHIDHLRRSRVEAPPKAAGRIILFIEFGEAVLDEYVFHRFLVRKMVAQRLGHLLGDVTPFTADSLDIVMMDMGFTSFLGCSPRQFLRHIDAGDLKAGFFI